MQGDDFSSTRLVDENGLHAYLREVGQYELMAGEDFAFVIAVPNKCQGCGKVLVVPWFDYCARCASLGEDFAPCPHQGRHYEWTALDPSAVVYRACLECGQVICALGGGELPRGTATRWTPGPGGGSGSWACGRTGRRRFYFTMLARIDLY